MSLLAVAVVILVAGCRSDATRLLDRSVEHLDAAIEILDDNRGHQDAAIAALDAYVKEHRAELSELRRDGTELLRDMDDKARVAFVEEARTRTAERLATLENLARTYDHPGRILQAVTELR